MKRRPKQGTVLFKNGLKIRLVCPVFDDTEPRCCNDSVNSACIIMAQSGECPELKIFKGGKEVPKEHYGNLVMFIRDRRNVKKEWWSKRGE